MQFLRTIFWVLLAVVAVSFAFDNWRVVTVRLWGDLVLDTPLPMLLLAAFLLGLVPGLILHRTTRWSLRRKLEAVTRNQFVDPAASVIPPVVPDPIPPQLR